MHYLGLALYAEGPTDYYFLRPLLRRLCEDICLEASQPVEIGEEVLALNEPAHVHGKSREERIAAAAQLARGAWRIVFIHSDGEGDPRRVRAERVQPAIDRVMCEHHGDGSCVAVIPIRETEAWALVDGDAIRRTFGTTLSDVSLGLPRQPIAVESILDPKKRLGEAYNATKPTTRRRRQGSSAILDSLGEAISLGRLRQLEAFRNLESELREALHKLNVLR